MEIVCDRSADGTVYALSRLSSQSQLAHNKINYVLCVNGLLLNDKVRHSSLNVGENATARRHRKPRFLFGRYNEDKVYMYKSTVWQQFIIFDRIRLFASAVYAQNKFKI